MWDGFATKHFCVQVNAMSFAIITPIWKKVLTEEEMPLVKITSATNPKVEKFFMAPKNLNCDYHRADFPDWKIFRIEDRHLSSISAYNQFMLTPVLYKSMLAFDFSVICQTDAVLIKDISTIELEDIDYVGSPWEVPIKMSCLGLFGRKGDTIREFLENIFELCVSLEVGNGGLSIRRNETFFSITKEIFYRKLVATPEDVFFSYLGVHKKLRVATAHSATKIFMETMAAGLTDLPDVYGFHALQRWNPGLFEQLLKDYREHIV